MSSGTMFGHWSLRMGTRFEVRYRRSAQDDLRSILRFIVESSGAVNTALAYIDRIEQRCLRLAEFPLSGHPRSDLGKDIFTVPFEGAMIVYTIEAEIIWVIRVFARGQDFESALRDS